MATVGEEGVLLGRLMLLNRRHAQGANRALHWVFDGQAALPAYVLMSCFLCGSAGEAC